MQRFDCVLNGCCQSAQNPLAAEWKLLSSQNISWCLEGVPQVDHSKLDSVPELVAPMPVCDHTLDVQIDIPSLKRSRMMYSQL